jgi:hypothetical protein
VCGPGLQTCIHRAGLSIQPQRCVLANTLELHPQHPPCSADLQENTETPRGHHNCIAARHCLWRTTTLTLPLHHQALPPTWRALLSHRHQHHIATTLSPLSIHTTTSVPRQCEQLVLHAVGSISLQTPPPICLLRLRLPKLNMSQTASAVTLCLAFLEENPGHSGPPILLALGGDVNTSDSDQNLMFDGIMQKSREAGSICWSKSRLRPAEFSRNTQSFPAKHLKHTTGQQQLCRKSYVLYSHTTSHNFAPEEWWQRRDPHRGLPVGARPGKSHHRQCF